MTLVLSVLRCPDAVPPETREVKGGEFNIGRGPENDWVLPDPDRHLSKRHCVLAFRSGGWQLADVSTNGTFVNREAEPVGPGRPRALRDGDRLHLGAYEIEVRIVEAMAPAGGRPSALAHSDPFGDDPFAPPAPAFGEQPPLGRVGGPDQVQLPADFDPLAPAEGDEGFGAPTQSDHSAALEDAFRPPTAPSLLPDDWDLDLSPAQPPAPAAPTAPPPRPRPVAPAEPPELRTYPNAPPVAAPPAPPRAAPVPPATEPLEAPVAPDVPVVPPRPTAQPPELPRPPAPPRASQRTVDETAEVVPPAAALPEAPPIARPAAAAADDASLVAAFLRGAGMPDAALGDPAAVFQELGRAFRVLVGELRAALIARAAVKGEFRIEQTMIRSSGNNPLKFSAGDDDALAALLGSGRRVEMKPSAAIADALRDLRLHELATMTAMQAAVRTLLQQFDPVALREEAEQGGLALVPAQRKARAWDAFEKLHARVSKALADDFDSVFGKAFARAYEQALDEAKGQGGQQG